VPVVFGVAAVGSVVYMYRLPEIDVPTTFKCPLVPLVPCAGIAINMSMMTGEWLCLPPPLYLTRSACIGLCVYVGVCLCLCLCLRLGHTGDEVWDGPLLSCARAHACVCRPGYRGLDSVACMDLVGCGHLPLLRRPALHLE
jgi:hypothetical protein